MMGEVAQTMLTIMNHSTPNSAGAITETQLPAAIACLQAAMAKNESVPTENHHASDHQEKLSVGLRQRAYPLLELLQASLQGKEPVTWQVAN